MIVFYKLKDVLRRRGLRDQDLASLTGCSTSTISKVMQSKNINLDVIAKICKALDVQPADIMEYIPDKE